MNKKIKKNWEFNVLGIDNYKKDGKLSYYYNFIEENINKIQGDLLEVGVFRGKTIISTALLLKELGSKKKFMVLIVLKVFQLKKTAMMTLVNLVHSIRKKESLESITKIIKN